ncbi:flagellar hook-length control protein FliK [Marinobacterium sp. D7]|uniref:flagellar hook-length control protein FliK n=1 Tax=Marinobacterium ramblicola TaxID=2849041 RepID=UPI001C2DE602|nr:flagellar hook-length control protein FliK [Marinobacterium ramblicola]MBV1789341.1 flagellar hook-length control protein FliK [Marinobacterium ramblicola]
MPASSVSLSSISVVNVAAASSAAAPAGAGVSQGAGAEHGFGQWMQKMQSAGGAAQRADGEKLPEEGKTLPVQRQQDDTPLNAEVETEAEADVNVEAKAEAASDSQPQVESSGDQAADAEPAAGDEVASAQGGEPLLEHAGAAASESPVSLPSGEAQMDDVNLAVDAQAAGASGNQQGDAEATAEQRGPVEAEAGQRQGDQVTHGESTEAVVSMPVQGARPEVREAALQNRGQTGEKTVASAENHGQQVSAVARGFGRESEGQGPVVDAAAEAVDPIASVPGEVAGAEGEVADVSNSGAVEAAAPATPEGGLGAAETVAEGGEGEAGAQPDGDLQRGERFSAAPVSESGDLDPESPVEAGGAVEAATAAAVKPADAGDRMQSARDTVAKSDVAQSVSVTNQKASSAGGSESGDAGNQQFAGQPRDQGQPLDRVLSAGGAERGARAQGEVGLQAETGRQPVVNGAETAGSRAANSPVTPPVQPALNNASTEMMSAAAMQRLQDPAWSRAMGQRAVMMAQYGPKSAEIKLDPPELGAMQIRIRVSGQDQVSVSFSSPHPAVRDAIEQQMPRLREMFAEQGLELSQSSVSDHSAEGGGDESSQARGRGGSGNYSGLDDGVESTPGVQRVAVGLVDYYA